MTSRIPVTASRFGWKAATVAAASLAFTFLHPSAASAQCTIQFLTGTFTSGGHIAHGQSFTACATGSVTTIEIQYEGAPVSGLTLKIFNGNTVTGSPAATQTGVSLGGGTGLKTITLAPAFPVISGQQYTFDVNVLSPVVYGTEPPASPETSYFSDGNFDTLMLNHRVTISAAVPALSPGWTVGLLLLLASVGVLALRRRGGLDAASY